MSEQDMQMKLALQQGKVNALRQEVAEMNEEREYWTKLHHQAAIAAMQGQLANPKCTEVQIESGVPFGQFYAINAVQVADALVAELKKGGVKE